MEKKERIKIKKSYDELDDWSKGYLKHIIATSQKFKKIWKIKNHYRFGCTDSLDDVANVFVEEIKKAGFKAEYIDYGPDHVSSMTDPRYVVDVSWTQKRRGAPKDVYYNDEDDDMSAFFSW